MVRPPFVVSFTVSLSKDGITDLSGAVCVAAHSCRMSSLSHDTSVTVQSFEDHLGFPLNVFDEVKLEDVIIAWCTHTGALIY